MDSPPDADGNPSVKAEVQVNTTTANAWEILIFDMALDTANFSSGISMMELYSTQI